jgi:hypothetical protein
LPYLQLPFSSHNYFISFFGLFPPQKNASLTYLPYRLSSPPPSSWASLDTPNSLFQGLLFDIPDFPSQSGRPWIIPHIRPRRTPVESPHVAVTGLLDLSCQEPVPVRCACPDSAPAFDRHELFFFERWLPSWPTNASRYQERHFTLESYPAGTTGLTARGLGVSGSASHHDRGWSTNRVLGHNGWCGRDSLGSDGNAAVSR